MKTKLIALLGLILPPGSIKTRILRLLGWRLAPSARIGFSWIEARSVRLDEGASIGHGNLIRARFIALKAQARVGHLNRVTGSLGLILREQSLLGIRNTVRRGYYPVVWGRAVLRLGRLSGLIYGHFVDCTRPVLIDDYSTFAGKGSQIWTHSYFHAPEGPGRFRVDGSVRIGHNVYIGTACVVTAGVRIAPAITVGANASISKSLTEPGLYVSQPLRLLEIDYAAREQGGRQVKVPGLVEKVLVKRST
jgi:hypothetical protein